MSVIKPNEFASDTFKVPSFWIVPSFVKLSVTVIDFSALLVNTLPLAILKLFWLIMPAFVKLLFKVKVPEPLIVPALDVLPLMIKADVLAIVPLLVKVLFTVTFADDVNVLPDATDKMF